MLQARIHIRNLYPSLVSLLNPSFTEAITCYNSCTHSVTGGASIITQLLPDTQSGIEWPIKWPMSPIQPVQYHTNHTMGSRIQSNHLKDPATLARLYWCTASSASFYWLSECGTLASADSVDWAACVKQHLEQAHTHTLRDQIYIYI